MSKLLILGKTREGRSKSVVSSQLSVLSDLSAPLWPIPKCQMLTADFQPQTLSARTKVLGRDDKACKERANHQEMEVCRASVQVLFTAPVDVVLFAISIASLQEIGMALLPEIEALVPEFAQLVLREVESASQ
jgi:hypothetical protein